MNNKSIIMITSWPPRKCGIATFAEEAVEFIKKEDPARPFYIISYSDGEGEHVFPIINLDRADWYKTVLEKIAELNPYAIHIQHEYGLYNYINLEGIQDRNEGFIKMLEGLRDFPVIIEPHTVHGRLREFEENFLRQLISLSTIMILKCHYQKWRLEWTFSSHGWKIPTNISVVPHGVRPDRRYPIEAMPQLKEEIGLTPLKGRHTVGLVGWIQPNKRWDILLNLWEDIHEVILKIKGEDWILLGAGDIRDPHHEDIYQKYISQFKRLEEKGMAYFYHFIPRGEIYYKIMAICDFIVLPSLDETQSGTLARVIALNKPYITSAPMEGLTAQSLESGGGLLFTNRDMLRQHVIKLATDEGLRWQLGYNLYRYLTEEVSWTIIARKYHELYKLAHEARLKGEIPFFAAEF